MHVSRNEEEEEEEEVCKVSLILGGGKRNEKFRFRFLKDAPSFLLYRNIR